MPEARMAIEGLRSGVPYRELAKTVAFGRGRHIEVVERLLQGVIQGRPAKERYYLVRANYGEGKTHFLHSLWGRAEDLNFVVTMVAISRESPLDRLDYLYPKLMENTFVPGSPLAGLDAIVERAFAEPGILPETRMLELSPRTLTVVENIVAQNEGYDELLADLSGSFLSMSELKRIHRQNYGKPLKLERSSVRDEVMQYVRLLDYLIHKAGYAGWLILFDEVELIGKLGKGQRSRAYANIGRFLTANLEHTVTVWSLAANFHADVLNARKDREAAPLWLQSRPKEAELAPLCEKGIDALMESKRLNPLSEADIRELIAQMHELHQEAYGWRVPFSAGELYDKVWEFSPLRDTKLRTWVRLTLTVLDVWFQYGCDPDISQVNALGETDLDEDTRALSEGDSSENVVVAPEGNAFEPDEPSLIVRKQLF